MASIDNQGSGNSKKVGVKKPKKSSTQIDMTPMVDLGFLLITFFIFTTTMNQPTAMNLFLPRDAKDSEYTKVKESGAFTILLGAQDKVYYYEGMDPSKIKKINLLQLRDLIIDKKNRTPKEDLVVIIKPTKYANYGKTIDILDEMIINQIDRYAMLDSSDRENELIGKK